MAWILKIKIEKETETAREHSKRNTRKESFTMLYKVLDRVYDSAPKQFLKI